MEEYLSELAGDNGATQPPPPADTTKPTVTITAPASSATLSGSAVSIQASANDNVAVSSVSFYDGVVLLGTDNSSPYSITWNTTSVSNGAHTLTAKVMDTSANVATSAPVNLTVNNVIADTTPPTSPSSLTASNITTSTITISRLAATDNTGVAGYEIYRNGINIGTSTTTSFNDSGLASKTAYSYTVLAYDAANNKSAQSAGLTVATLAPPDTQAPSVLEGVSATPESATSVKLTWPAATDNVGVTGYYIQRGGVTVALVTNGLNYTDSDLLPTTDYSYVVRARDAAGNVAAASNTATVTTPALPDTTAPSTPGNLNATTVRTTQVNLAWVASTDNVGVMGYNIFRNGTKVGTSSGTSYGDTGLDANTTYTYSVSAFDAAGNTSSQTNNMTVRTAVEIATVVLESYSKAAVTPATKLVLPKPPTMDAGDVMVASIDSRTKAETTVIVPEGWTLVTETNTSTNTMTKKTYYKVVTDTEPSSYSWGMPEGRSMSGMILGFSGIDTAQPIFAKSSLDNYNTAEIIAPSVYTTAKNFALGLYTVTTRTTVTPPLTLPGIDSVSSVGSSANITSAAAGKVIAATRNTGDRIATVEGSEVQEGIGQLIALRAKGN